MQVFNTGYAQTTAPHFGKVKPVTVKCPMLGEKARVQKYSALPWDYAKLYFQVNGKTLADFERIVGSDFIHPNNEIVLIYDKTGSRTPCIGFQSATGARFIGPDTEEMKGFIAQKVIPKILRASDQSAAKEALNHYKPSAVPV